MYKNEDKQLRSQFPILIDFRSKYNFNCLSKYNKQQLETSKHYPANQVKSNKYKMRIQTFEKIESKLFYVTLLPISLFIAVAIFFTESLWQSHFFIASSFFLISLIACFYLVTVNIMEKPLGFLMKMYQDNRKYKTVHELKTNQTEGDKKELNPEETCEEQDFGISTAQVRTKQEAQRNSMHIAFGDLDENIENSHEQPTIPHSYQPPKQKSPPRKIQSRKSLQEPSISKPTPIMPSNDLFNLYTYTNPKFQSKKPERKSISPLKNQIDEKSEILRQRIDKILGSQEDIEAHVRQEYEDRYAKYKQSLEEFSINKEIMEKFVSETKSVLKQKIHQHLKKQFQNLDSIESILKKNFTTNFRSYKDRSQESTARNIYSFGSIQGYGPRANASYQEKSPFNKKESFGHQNLGKEMKFSEVLHECINLLQTNYFEFDYVGDQEKINEVKNELKLLIRERMELDKYLYLKKPLTIGKNLQTSMGTEESLVSSEFQQERYMIILKLQTLENILSQRQSAQQNLLKEFFSKNHSYSTEYTEQINDERNIAIVMNFFVRILREKLVDSANDDLIKVQLSRPNFHDRSVNLIWVKKQSSAKSHYDVIYSLKKDEKTEKKDETDQKTEDQKLSKDQPKQDHETFLHCCPGQKNLWTCMTFVRLLISKIGLKKEDYPKIKDRELRKDFKRLFQLMK